MPFNGLFTGMDSICRLSKAKSRSICCENPTGEKGKGGMAEANSNSCSRDLGKGWKIKPCVSVKPGETFTMCDINDSGSIQHIWITPTGHWRHSILRIYWDGQENPSVECPAGDFFASGWGGYAQLSSLAVCVNPGSAFNCYWPMPFHKRCRMTMTNIGLEEMRLFYQIDYSLNDVPDDAAYFHAQFRRKNPVAYKDVYTIIDGIKGQGQYVGTYMAWQVNNNGWWGEGEIKFYLDGDCPPGEDIAERGGNAFPTICGTGTEDYFCGSYNFENKAEKRYEMFTTPYAGLHQVIKPDGLYNSQQRFGMYRWHITDPIRFEEDLMVTIQDLGWRKDGRYLPQQSDIASVAFWYQNLPSAPFPPLPDADYLEVI